MVLHYPFLKMKLRIFLIDSSLNYLIYIFLLNNHYI